MSATPFAVLLQFNFARNELAVLTRPIVNAVALGARQFDELVLGHGRHYTARQSGAQFVIGGIFRSTVQIARRV